jgi:hypothetical protein
LEISSPISRDRAAGGQLWIGLRFGTVVAAAVGLFFLVRAHVEPLNGPEYWRWKWRELAPETVYPAMSLGLVLVLAALLLFERRPARRTAALHLLAGATLVIELASVLAQAGERGLLRVSDIVESAFATSYLTATSSFTSLRPWLSSFDTILETLPLHANNKPPGPVLFYVVLKAINGDNLQATALAGGLIIVVLAALAGPATYWMCRTLRFEPAAAFAAAAVMALSPGLCLFVPEFDQVWPLLTCALVAVWAVALERRSLAWAAGFGAALAAAAFIAFHVFALGLFLGGLSVAALLRAQSGLSLKRLAAMALTALATFAVIYLMARLFLGYDLIRVLPAAMRNAEAIIPKSRIYPGTIGWDFFDALLGFSWAASLVLFTSLVGVRAPGSRGRIGYALLAILQLAVIAVAGLYKGETARVCIYLFPLLAVAVGLELARWRLWQRAVFFAACTALTAAILENIVFIDV